VQFVREEGAQAPVRTLAGAVIQRKRETMGLTLFPRFAKPAPHAEMSEFFREASGIPDLKLRIANEDGRTEG
jgi:hypothetical protein